MRWKRVCEISDEFTFRDCMAVPSTGSFPSLPKKRCCYESIKRAFEIWMQGCCTGILCFFHTDLWFPVNVVCGPSDRGACN